MVGRGTVALFNQITAQIKLFKNTLSQVALNIILKETVWNYKSHCPDLTM